MKQISNEEMKKLIKNKYIHNSRKGFVDKNGENVGFYRTRNKRYIEDKYLDIARKIQWQKISVIFICVFNMRHE